MIVSQRILCDIGKPNLFFSKVEQVIAKRAWDPIANHRITRTPLVRSDQISSLIMTMAESPKSTWSPWT